MIQIPITTIKTFMNDLLVSDKFDHFLVTEVSITTFNTFTIDGHIHKSYYSEEEMNQLPDSSLSSWKTIKPICFSLIKGHKLPGRFKIILSLSPNGIATFLESVKLPYQLQDIGGLYLNLKYEDNTLLCTTGTALTLFTLDKTLEKSWDESIQKQFSLYY